MATNKTGQNGLPTQLPLRQDISVLNMGLRMTPEASQRYSDLWKQLTEHHPPTEHLGLVMAIITLAKLHSTFADNQVASCLVSTFIQSKHIPGLFAVLPRLPEELAAVMPDLLCKTTNSILMLPALPNEFNEIFFLSPDDETAFRRQLPGLQPKLKHAISLSDDEFEILSHSLPSLPSNISAGCKVPLKEYASVNKEYQGLSDQLRVVWSVGSYQDWFAVYNAISFFEGLTSFAAAIESIKPSKLQMAYWGFYHHFIRTLVASCAVKV
ncbi:hypothetical protein PITC_045990 [Penicillium italicum]|uniref:Uncharacterized protein n=1 Tax=Penicillium italicum TaxID=40296 RepID=A0A0A2KIR4_PENIT|nr:hypothetical protein PITC_045990 [Penicillium italicum]